MFGFKRVTIAQHERGLVFRERSFETVLEPGVHWMFDPLQRREVQRYDLTVPEFEHARVDFLVKEARAAIERASGETGLPAVDPIRFDPAPLAEAVVAFDKQRRGGQPPAHSNGARGATRVVSGSARSASRFSYSARPPRAATATLSRDCMACCSHRHSPSRTSC